MSAAAVATLALLAGQAHATTFTITDLGTLGGTRSAGYGINGAGQVVGFSDIAGDSAYHAFRSGGTGLQDLGTLGGTSSYSQDINNAGQVVGTSFITGNTTVHAFRSTSTGLQDLGTLGGTGSTGDDINNAGQVVGDSFLAGNAAQHAFLWDGTTMYDLNSLITVGSGWELTIALAINDVGQITGSGTINGQTHAFLLTSNTPAPVPEPASVALFGLGLLGLGYMRRSWTV